MVLQRIPTFEQVKSWVNNNADVPNADHADNADHATTAGDADTVDGNHANEIVASAIAAEHGTTGQLGGDGNVTVQLENEYVPGTVHASCGWTRIGHSDGQYTSCVKSINTNADGYVDSVTLTHNTNVTNMSYSSSLTWMVSGVLR